MQFSVATFLSWVAIFSWCNFELQFLVGAILSCNFTVDATLSCNFIASWCNFELLLFLVGAIFSCYFF